MAVDSTSSRTRHDHLRSVRREALRGTAQLAGRQDRAASLFSGGSGRCDIVKTIVSDDVVVIIQVERNEARVHRTAVPQSWILRTTQVFERR